MINSFTQIITKWERGREGGRGKELEDWTYCHSNDYGLLTTNRHNHHNLVCDSGYISTWSHPLRSSSREFPTSPHCLLPTCLQCRKMCLTTLCKLFGCFSAVYLNIPTMCFTADTRHYVDREWMYEMCIRVLTASKDSSSVYLINVCYLWSLSMENKTNDLKCPCLYFLTSGMFPCLGYLLDDGIFLISYLLCLVK